MSSIKMRISAAGDVLDVKSLIEQVMETGRLKDKATGQLIPANYIQTLTVAVNDKVAVEANLSVAVSKNPYINVKVPGKKGDKVTIAYTTNEGKTDTETMTA
ncbi:MAG: thiosulfate oxidation carrier complex protein SoxZ [Halothiobacillus sp. 24-54-40]|jgi:sulfur-oxidizing protein SoxZ|nr:thiosulfate oxidation carrier complex protein SoxZ [Halothiobacillaceae bacterium]OYV46004.1 MAG: thiosulfate oxidation carrier complex protein SoxZ [Halothiobacillus sp. 20-53-49]OYY32608.1 MAG: thiosulfate oxidation carrier complex protein SoxZ [Halothiobacillus sp. 35-54-62]OYY51723.1 MAG: thiosulfate oxidation carrier complex protein SoxZ [Halothiobacillus sp. 28-55-5]OYZ85769.1 MAG: thiosulfate oxidation carrier complex protein SoxZ [Halothiobacillus sp. 24-54-40]OZA79273.1 MAG: thiosu